MGGRLLSRGGHGQDSLAPGARCESGIRSNRWGFAGSPLIWRDLVILNAGLAGTALDRATGRIVWSSGTNTAGYATPVLWRSAGQDQVLIFAGKGHRRIVLDAANARQRALVHAECRRGCGMPGSPLKTLRRRRFAHLETDEPTDGNVVSKWFGD